MTSSSLTAATNPATNPLQSPRFAFDRGDEHEAARHDQWQNAAGLYRTPGDVRHGSEAPSARFEFVGLPTPTSIQGDASLPAMNPQFPPAAASLYPVRSPHSFRPSADLPMAAPLVIPGTNSDWSYPSSLPPPTLADGPQLHHLPAPFSNAQSPASDSATSSRHSAIPPVPRPRKNHKTRDLPDTLSELRDPHPGEKPDYTFPVLIRCAILSHARKCPTLAEIYEMIHLRFAYYKMDDSSWKNSVRHYLSISPSFVKQSRPITEPGKGNYWTYDPNPQAKPVRKRASRKRRTDLDDEDDGATAPSARGFQEGQRSRSARIDGLGSPQGPPSEDGHTPSSSDMGDSAAGASGPSAEKIASRYTNPAYPWLEASQFSERGGEHGRQNRENPPPSKDGALKHAMSPRFRGEIPDPPFNLHFMQGAGRSPVAHAMAYPTPQFSEYLAPQYRQPPLPSMGAPYDSFSTGAATDDRHTRALRQLDESFLSPTFDARAVPLVYNGHQSSANDNRAGYVSGLPTAPPDRASWR